MSHFNNVRVPVAAFNQTGDMLQGPQTYVFPQAVPLHKSQTTVSGSKLASDPPSLFGAKTNPPHPSPHSDFWTQLKEWLSKPLNLSLIISIIALVLVILF